MTLDLTTLDAHQQPDPELKATWKRYSRTDHGEFINHPDIDELDVTDINSPFKLAGHIPSETLKSSFEKLEGREWDVKEALQDAPIYFHPLLPGKPSSEPPANERLIIECRVAHISLIGAPKHTEITAIAYGP